MVNRSVDAYLQVRKARAGAGEAGEIWGALESHYLNKQWHQLTNRLKEALKKPSFTKDLNLKELYTEFIKDFESRLNVLSFIQILSRIATSLPPTEAVEFLSGFKARLTRKGEPGMGGKTIDEIVEEQALVLLNSQLVAHKLLIKDNSKKVLDIMEIRSLVEETGKLVEGLPEVTPVHGDFHKAYAAYLCETADHGGYYAQALRYLGCVDLAEVSEAEQKLLAQRLCLSALLGKGVYNFGELLAHPILNVLKGAPEQWLADLVLTFNAGDIRGFKAAKDRWGKAYDVVANEAALTEKIRLLAILQTAFDKPIAQRTLTFAELASRLQCPESEVELFVMKALSRNLIKGSIDEIRKVVEVTWVMPRVLDKPLIRLLEQRIRHWSSEVKKTSEFVTANAGELIVS